MLEAVPSPYPRGSLIAFAEVTHLLSDLHSRDKGDSPQKLPEHSSRLQSWAGDQAHLQDRYWLMLASPPAF